MEKPNETPQLTSSDSSDTKRKSSMDGNTGLDDLDKKFPSDSNKRSKLDTMVSASPEKTSETLVSPCSDACNDSEGAASQATSKDPPLDLATTLGYKDGDRLEVQWEIHNVNDDKEEDDDEDGTVEQDLNSTSLSSKTVWWKATLLEHDGRTTDSVAIRTLLYDARPDLGFPEPSKEDVVFLGHDLLVSPHDDSIQLKYKRDGLTEAENQLLVCKDNQLDEQLNQIVMGTLQKNEKLWRAMPAAAQAAIAEKMRKMKEKMKEKLQALGPQVVITSETIQKLLAESF
ncbi:hypothetical protein IV203_038253 [Nitzschia inconspicua]|uniref:Uncharacterized protein n=1 Tax=Nitzschia inconspicua TaxID=303405 RepID=A0A9K3PZL4_9STRA|nr:hypothetical protein IV203_038253 [Nitzschia inconspicua]